MAEKVNIPIITVTNQPERAKPLIDTATKNNWQIIVIQTEWKGFGTKLIATYNFLKEHPEIEQFVFCDAHDVVVLGDPEEFLMKKNAHFVSGIVFNAERGCWPPPVQHFEYMYKRHGHGFNFLNSGVYYAPAKLFKEIFESNPPEFTTDDQWLYSMIYLFGRWPVVLDADQALFNCHSFRQDGEYSYNDKRIQINGNQPIFIHSNGGTGSIDDKLNQMLIP